MSTIPSFPLPLSPLEKRVAEILRALTLSPSEARSNLCKAPDPVIEELIKLFVQWGGALGARGDREGRALSPAHQQLAARLGVLEPETIRVLPVPSIPFVGSPVIRAATAAVGMTIEHIGSIALHHAIIVREDQQHRTDIWPHEFRHVAHYECLGGFQGFMAVYIRELVHFGYGAGPLEIDAKHAERLG
jgi:hypothetical protein